MSIAWSESYLGQLRALAGDRTLLLTASRVLVRRDDGTVLLIRRSDNGLWALPAGVMELGESITDCAVRELWEETGLTATAVTPFALLTGPEYTYRNHFGDTYQHFVVLFRADAWDGELLTRTDETTDAGFYRPEAAPRPASPSILAAVADLADFETTGRLVVK